MVARPLYFSHPKDETAMKTDDQFMWGDSIMFTPVLYEVNDDIFAVTNGITMPKCMKILIHLCYHRIQQTEKHIFRQVTGTAFVQMITGK